MILPPTDRGHAFGALPRLKHRTFRGALVGLLLTAGMPASVIALSSTYEATRGGEEWARSAAATAARELSGVHTRLVHEIDTYAEALGAGVDPSLPPTDVLVLGGETPRVIADAERARDDAAEILATRGLPAEGCALVAAPRLAFVCRRPAGPTLAELTLLCLPPAGLSTSLSNRTGAEILITSGDEILGSSWRTVTGEPSLPRGIRARSPGEDIEVLWDRFDIPGGYGGFDHSGVSSSAGDESVAVISAGASLPVALGPDLAVVAAVPVAGILSRPAVGLAAATVVAVFLVLAQLPVLRRQIAGVLDPVTEAADEIHRLAVALSRLTQRLERDDSSIQALGPTDASVELAMLSAARRRLRREVRRAQEMSRWRDEMEQKLLEATEEAQRSDRAKTEFVANMSHELRTPLTLIIGHTELLLESCAASALEDREDLEPIHHSSLHLLSLINDLLDVAKIEAGALIFRPTPFLLRPLLETVADGFQAVAAAGSNTLRVEVEEIPALHGDPVRIEQIVTNLVSNALKFTSGGTVTIAAKRVRGRVFVEVQDTGEGMSSEELDSVFGAFVQGDASSTRGAGGTGLGLTITRKLAEAMDGSVDVHSRPGTGSTFVVQIPLPEADPDDSSEPSPMEYAKTTHGRHLALRR